MTNTSYHLPAMLALLAAIAATGCSRLSGDARRIAGNYYLDALSHADPVYELRDDATCTIRAIRPGVLSYAVDGSWNVVGDSLIAILDPATLSWEGDSTLIGDITTRYGRHLVASDDHSITLEVDGVNYTYRRHNNQ